MMWSIEQLGRRSRKAGAVGPDVKDKERISSGYYYKLLVFAIRYLFWAARLYLFVYGRAWRLEGGEAD